MLHRQFQDLRQHSESGGLVTECFGVIPTLSSKSVVPGGSMTVGASDSVVCGVLHHCCFCERVVSAVRGGSSLFLSLFASVL